MEIPAVLETVVYAHDLAAAERFYTRVLGLAVHSRETGRHVFFRCGRGMFLVFDPRATATSTSGLDVPNHGAEGPGHMAFACRPATSTPGGGAWPTTAWPSSATWPGPPAGTPFTSAIPRATASSWRRRRCGGWRTGIHRARPSESG